MRVIDYKCITGSKLKDGIIVIPEIDRTNLATPQFQELSDLKVNLERKTALIYLAGASLCQSDADVGVLVHERYVPAIKYGHSYNAHSWVKSFENTENLVHMEVVEGTCASGINAVKRANELLMSMRVDEVIIIGYEKIPEGTKRLFKELRMPVTCGDGFAYMRLERGFELADFNWKWAYNPNPFVFTKKDLNTLIPDYRIGYVKLHGTGTAANTAAEEDLEALATPLVYKDKIGHTQGISALIETCLVLDNPKIRGRILVTANGLGGYFGSFTLTKPNAR